MKNVQIALYKVTTTKNSYGRSIENMTQIDTLSGTLLPITTEMAKKQYGYTENVEKQFFYKGLNPEFKKGNVIVTEDEEKLTIVHVADFIKLKVVLLKKYVRQQDG